MNEPKWTLHLSLSNGLETYNFAQELDRDTIDSGMSPRLREEMDMGRDVGIATVSFDQMVRMMKRREFRKELMIETANRLGARLAEHMEDKEGWHGMERAEAAKQAR